MGTEAQRKSWEDLFVGLRMGEIIRSDFRTLSGAQLKVYLILRAQMDWDTWESECSLRNMADMSGTTIQAVQYILKQLTLKGLIERTFKGMGHRMCQYKVRVLGGQKILGSEIKIFTPQSTKKLGDLTTEDHSSKDKQEAANAASAPNAAEKQPSAAEKEAPTGAGAPRFAAAAANGAGLLALMAQKGITPASARTLIEKYGIERCREAISFEKRYPKKHTPSKIIAAFLSKGWNTPGAAVAAALQEKKGVQQTPSDRRQYLNQQLRELENDQKHATSASP